MQRIDKLNTWHKFTFLLHVWDKVSPPGGFTPCGSAALGIKTPEERLCYGHYFSMSCCHSLSLEYCGCNNDFSRPKHSNCFDFKTLDLYCKCTVLMWFLCEGSAVL